MLYQARAQAWREGAIESGAQALHERFLAHGNPFGDDLESALDTFTSEADFQRKGRVLFRPGCRSLAECPEQAAATLSLLRRLGADHVSLPARDDVPGCCGGPLRAIGDETGLQTTASGLQQYFNRQRTWVTTSSSCLGTVSDGYRDAGFSVNAELLHLSEYLLFFRARLSTLGSEATSLWAKDGGDTPQVLIHDACGLHRRLNRGSAVHQVVETLTGRPAQSLAHSPGRTHCCGAGDFFDLRCPDSAATVADWSAQAQPAPAASWIVTGDSDCVEALRGSYPQNEVMGLSSLLERWLEPILNVE
jgi:Fe-S oxidoreductase